MELVEIIISASGKTGDEIYSKKYDIMYSQVDISLAKNNLRYHPKF